MSKLKEKGRKILRKRKNTNIQVPTIDPEKYTGSILSALNYYNTEVDDNKKKRAWALEYWKGQGKDVKDMAYVPDAYFHTIGAVAHLALNDSPLKDRDLNKLETYYTDFLMKAGRYKTAKAEDEKDKPEKKVVNIQDSLKKIADIHIAEFEHAIDEEILGAGTEFNAKNYITSKELSSPVVKKIGDWVKQAMVEITAAHAGKDKDLVEGYSHLGKRGLTKYKKFLQGILDDCDEMYIKNKTTRAPRKRKAQPPAKVVEKMKWMREFAELEMKSVPAQKILGCDEVWLYDTSKRRLFKYSGSNIQVKGTTLLNWEPSQSGSKIIRNPEVFFKGHDKLTKRSINKSFKEIKGVTGKVNGRTNDNQIILKAF